MSADEVLGRFLANMAGQRAQIDEMLDGMLNNTVSAVSVCADDEGIEFVPIVPEHFWAWPSGVLMEPWHKEDPGIITPGAVIGETIFAKPGAGLVERW